MIDRISPPPTFDIEHFLLSKPKQTLLDNNSSLFQFYNSNLDLIHFNIRVKVGLLYENQKYLAQACFNLLKESSTKRTAAEMDEILDFYGASWSVSVNMEFISIQWVIPKSNCKDLLPLLLEVLHAPVFKEENLERYKQKKIKDLEYNELKYNYKATQLMFSALFESDSPMGVMLHKDHINDVSVSQIQKYYDTYFNASNISFFTAGNIDLSLEKLIEQSFSTIQKGVQSELISNLKVVTSPQLILDYKEDAIQSSFLLCKKGLSYTDPSRKSFSFLSTLLGGYFGSRLMQNLREKNGYTYGVQNGSIYFRNQSIFYIESDVAVDKTKEAIEQCFLEIKRLQEELVSEEEIKVVQRYLQGTILRDVDGVISFMKKYAYWHGFGLDESEMEETIFTLNHINNDMIIKNANIQLQRDDFYTIIVGKN